MKATCFMSKATSVPQANHSQYSSPVEALNLIVESKSLPVEVNNSTIELHLSEIAKDIQRGERKAFNHRFKMWIAR